MSEIIERRPGEIPTMETRAESEKLVDKRKRYEQIVEVMGDYMPLSAKEIAVRMFIREYIPDKDRNHVSPRLTEMMKEPVKVGKTAFSVEPVGKKRCEYTGHTVTVFRLMEVVPDA